ncbi:tetratricopeptide repeat protein [Candidatus Peregrinibacteria bacterium]|nr:tetratricopeptide repeat protein [Candidatus Peregrinibacteria bacterium]
MKKITAIIAAVILAFVIALGDQIIKLNAFDSIRSFLGLEEETITIPHKPKLPTIVEKKPEELNLSYEERMDKGDDYYDRGFLTLASNEYVKAANLEPDRVKPYLQLIKVNFDLTDYDKARNNAEEVLKLEPGNYEARYFLVLTAIKQSDFNEAEQRIDQLLGETITDARLLYYQALIKIAFSQHDEAKTLLNEAKANLAAGDELIAKIDRILAGYNEFEFAKAAEELYLSELLTRAFNQIGEYELAVYKSKEILKTRPELRDAWILLGFAYLNLEKYLFALTSFEHAYEIDPEWPATQYFLGITYAEIPRNEDAIVYLNYALNNGFEPAIVVKQKLADLYLDVGNYEESVKAYQEVLDYNKQDINAFVRPIWIYLDFLNQPDKAMKLGEAAVISFPEDAMAYNLLGWSQIGTGNLIEAEKNLKKAVGMDADLTAAYYNLAKLYESQDEVEPALENYQKAYELDQNGSIGNLAAKRYNALLLK